MTQTDASSLDVVLRLAAAAYLGRYTGVSRLHSEPDLRLFFTWCVERDLPPLAAQRAQIELYMRWMQEVRRFKPSKVSRRMAVVTGFYRTCVIDTVLEHSPADYVRRPRVPNESPVLGLSHLQFEARLAAARESTNKFDFALIAMLGLLGLAFPKPATPMPTISEKNTATGSRSYTEKAAKRPSCPCLSRSDGPSTTP